MPRIWTVAMLLLLGAGPVAAQDMPLSQVLIDGKGWKPLPPDKPEVVYQSIQGLAYLNPVGTIAVLDNENKTMCFVSGDRVIAWNFKSGTASRGLTRGLEEGRLYYTSPDNACIYARTYLEMETVYAKDIAAHDLVMHRSGTLYATVPSEHAVYAIAKDGTKRKVAEDIAQPTGITLWPDHGTLIVADAAGKHLLAFRVEKDGTLTAREGYYTLRTPAGQKASGAGAMCVDTAGRLYVTSTVGVQCFDPTGRLNGVLLNPTPTPPTALTFGGPNRDLLYLACGDKLFVRETKVQGLPFGK